VAPGDALVDEPEPRQAGYGAGRAAVSPDSELLELSGPARLGVPRVGVARGL